MKKNTLFYLLLQSVCVFLFFFMIESRPFDTVKNFFTKSIDNVKKNLKKGYQWFTQKETPIKDEKETIKNGQKIHFHHTHQSIPIKNKNNQNNENTENQEKITNNKKPEISKSTEITEKIEIEKEKIDAKKKIRNKRLEKLLSRFTLKQLNQTEFREKLIDKYNNYITEKAAKKGKTIEPNLLLTSEELDTSLKYYKKKRHLKENWKKKYQKKLTQKKGSLETSTSKNSDWEPIDKTNIEKSEEYIAKKTPPSTPPQSEDEKKDPEIEKKVENLLIPSLKLYSLSKSISLTQEKKSVIPPNSMEVIKNNEAIKDTPSAKKNATTLDESIIDIKKDISSNKDNNQSNAVKESNKIKPIVL